MALATPFQRARVTGHIGRKGLRSEGDEHAALAHQRVLHTGLVHHLHEGTGKLLHDRGRRARGGRGHDHKLLRRPNAGCPRSRAGPEFAAFIAGRYRPARTAPLAPAACVQGRWREARPFHRESVVECAAATAALVDHGSGMAAVKQPFKLLPKDGRRLELAVGADSVGEGPVQRSRNMTRRRIHRLTLPPVARRPACIDDGLVWPAQPVGACQDSCHLFHAANGCISLWRE